MGTRNVGGDNLTSILSDYLAEEFNRKFKVDPRESKRGKLKLYNNAETVKHILSTLDTAKCYIESLCDGIDFSTNVTRARFENEMSKMLPSLIDPIREVLTASGIKASDIDKLTLRNVNKESKISLSCHIHRDGSVHFALTDKTTGQCDQVTLQGPQSK